MVQSAEPTTINYPALISARSPRLRVLRLDIRRHVCIVFPERTPSKKCSQQQHHLCARMSLFAWLREIGLRLLSTLGLYNKKGTVVLLGESRGRCFNRKYRLPSDAQHLFARDGGFEERGVAACMSARGLADTVTLARNCVLRSVAKPYRQLRTLHKYHFMGFVCCLVTDIVCGWFFAESHVVHDPRQNKTTKEGPAVQASPRSLIVWLVIVEGAVRSPRQAIPLPLSSQMQNCCGAAKYVAAAPWPLRCTQLIGRFGDT